METLLKLAQDHLALVIGGAVAALLVVVLVTRAVAKAARKADEPLANVAMLLGLGWSSEAVWELSEGLPTGLRIAIFSVLEVILLVSMVRTKRAVEELGRAGRAGRTVWVVASVMAVVGIFAADGLGEGALRAAVPLLLTLTWWQGVVPEGLKRADGAVSWRWTPRRLLLALGAIEPGERDIETVNRERLTQQLTRLEFGRQHGLGWLAPVRKARLMRLSLHADDDMIAEVRQRVARASWFTVTQLRQVGGAPLTQADDAPATQGLVVPTRRVTRELTRPLTSSDAAGADPAARAASLVVTQGMAVREAARETGAAEATVRRRVKEMTQPDATQATQKTNGHPVLAAGQ